MSDISIADPEVSRQHARLTRTADGGYELQDLGSTNGTFVEGNRLGGNKVSLKPGQVVVVGSNVTLVYEMLPEQTATVIASREELDFGDAMAPSPEPPPPPVPEPYAMDYSATEKLSEEPKPPDSDATIIDSSFAQPAYPVFSAAEPEPEPAPSYSVEPEPLPSFDDSWSTPASKPEDKGMPVYEPASSSAPPPPPPPMGGDSGGDGGNRNRILIAVVAVLLLCCCCSLLVGGYYYGDLLMELAGL